MPFTIVTGPCVIESEELALQTAQWLSELAKSYPSVHFVYKSSYDKANRTSASAYRGPGLKKGLEILEKIKSTYQLPIFTDVHSVHEALQAGEICDYIQIPAFLCRQTDLLVAAGRSKAAVNIKKGQFMAPWDMVHAIDKIKNEGKKSVIVTERGFSFGYNNLVSDMRAIPIMQTFGCPVLFDATHSVQLPGSQGICSGGERQFISTLSCAAVAAGCDGIYAEAHPDPASALCDAKCMLACDMLPQLIDRWLSIHEVIQKCPVGI